MTGLRVITNNAPRPLLDWENLTPAEQAGFDWVDPAGGESFFRYRGAAYALGEFMTAPGDLAAAGWHGYASDSAFSGVLVKLDPDGETVTAGRCLA